MTTLKLPLTPDKAHLKLLYCFACGTMNEFDFGSLLNAQLDGSYRVYTCGCSFNYIISPTFGANNREDAYIQSLGLTKTLLDQMKQINAQGQSEVDRLRGREIRLNSCYFTLEKMCDDIIKFIDKKEYPNAFLAAKSGLEFITKRQGENRADKSKPKTT